MEDWGYVYNILASVGLFSSTYFITLTAKSLIHYMKEKQFPKTLLEEKYFLLKEENQRLSQKIAQLEKENEDITRAILQRIT